MALDVQSWLDSPGTSFGWILRGRETERRSAKRFNTRENPDIGSRPRLTIDFTPPGVPAACCLGGDVCSELTQAECAAQGGVYQGDGTLCELDLCPVVLEPFVDPLPVPPAAQPVTGTPGGEAAYEISMVQVESQMHRDLPPTTVWGYSDGVVAGFLGPTIEAWVNSPVTVRWINDLRDELGSLRTDHYLAVDTCPHGADDQSPRTVVHLHGGHVPQEFDGYPESTFLPGEDVVYLYNNNQLPSTLWYHDHALGITRLNVYMGLAGAYLLRDAFETGLNLPAGEYEMPLVIQDRRFRSDGSFLYPAQWQDHFFGDKVLVNGKVWPYLNVKQGKYRFRLLNGSNSRTYTLALSEPVTAFVQVGTEGGLLPEPVPLTELTMGPGERADVIIDFEGIPAGTEIVITNSAPAPFPGAPGVGVIPEIMKFIVTAEPGHTVSLPATLRAVEPLLESTAVEHRGFVLRKGTDPCTETAWLINGLHWNDITEYPELGTTEVWNFINRSGISHPMHMHLVMFQILDRQAFELVDDQIVPVGDSVPPAASEAGWKDTVLVNPNEMVRVIAHFEGHTGKYAYHCHILEHEDHEMMRQFQTVDCGQGVLEPSEECDDGNTLDGDGCSSSCQREEYSYLEGQAEGGTVQQTVEGVVISVDTSAGQTAAEVMAALAAAINADPTLTDLGIYAFAVGNALITNGSLGEVIITDPGLTQVLSLTHQESSLWWASISGATSYDLVQGDLVSLNESAGDFTLATRACLANDQNDTSFPSSQSPAPGSGYWYLVRDITPAGNGTYDTGDPAQQGSRDAGIDASAQACP